MNVLLRALAYGVILINLLPAIGVGGFLFKPDLLIVGLMCIIVLSDTKNYVLRQKEVKFLWVIGVSLFLLMFISDNLGYYYYKPDYSLYFPRESIQIFARISALVAFMYIGHGQIIKSKKFFRIVSLSFLLSLAFGLLQKVGGVPLIESISIDFYALSEQQIQSITSTNARVFGTAGNVLTWGGLSMMMFFYFYFIEKRKVFKTAGILLALTNVFISGSRASILATIIAFVFIQFYRAIAIDKKISKAFLRVVVMVILGLASVWVLLFYFSEQIEFIAFRFLNTQDDLTQQGRGAQLQYFLRYFDGQPILYFFGIGKPIMDDGLMLMEIEFTYLLFAYGLLGFVLHYWLIWLVVKLARKLWWINEKYYLFLITGIIGFIIFSVGYYFFREIIGGLPFWWLSGYLLGVMLREQVELRRATEKNNEQIFTGADIGINNNRI